MPHTYATIPSDYGLRRPPVPLYRSVLPVPDCQTDLGGHGLQPIYLTYLNTLSPTLPPPYSAHSLLVGRTVPIGPVVAQFIGDDPALQTVVERTPARFPQPLPTAPPPLHALPDSPTQADGGPHSRCVRLSQPWARRPEDTPTLRLPCPRDDYIIA